MQGSTGNGIGTGSASHDANENHPTPTHSPSSAAKQEEVKTMGENAKTPKTPPQVVPSPDMEKPDLPEANGKHMENTPYLRG